MDDLKQLREQQRSAWNTFSPGWKKWDTFFMGFFRPIGAQLIEAVALQDGYQVLDVATGTGEPGLTAAQKIPHGKVTGTDIAQDMVKVANEHAQSRGIKNYEAMVLSDEHQPFPDDSFDAVICRFGIMYFPDMAEGLREMVRVLKSDRNIALSAWAEPAKNTWATTMSSVINTRLAVPPPPPDAPTPFRCGTPGTLTQLFQNAGLKDVEERELKGQVTFDSPSHYWDVMTAVAPPLVQALSSADDTKRQEIQQAVFAAAKQYERDGTIVFDWSSWITVGMK